MERNLTTGSVRKSVLLFSLPYLLSYFFQTLYGMADLLIIGQFDNVAGTTAVSIGSQVMHMITVIIVGLAMGATVNIGQSAGAGDKKKEAKYIGNTVTLFMGVAVILTIVLLALNKGIVGIMSTPEQAVDGTIKYLIICFSGIPFITAYNIISSIYRGMGDSKSPMYFIAVACVVNIILDYLFIGVIGLGTVGAALGTTLSQGVSVIVSLIVMIKGKNDFNLSRNDFKPLKETMNKILKIGIPVALQDGFIQVSFILITIIVNKRGLNDAAAVGIVEKIISFLFLVPSSMLSTVSALGAHNIGAGKPKRAKQVLACVMCIATLFGLIIGIIMQFISKDVVALFLDKKQAQGAIVVILGSQYLRGYVWDVFFAGIHFSFSGYFCACGRSEISFLHNIIAIIAVRVPGAYLMSKLFTDTLLPMGLATATGSLLSVIVCVIAFLCIRKKENAMIQN